MPLPRFPHHARLLRALLCTLALGGAAAGRLSAASTATLPWGDQGDGTFVNPVLFADYSDPDVIRVGDDFYLVASDFHFMGIQVLHSRDLVNWRLAGRVADRLPIDPKYDTMDGYGQGTWAPTLRHQDGLFQVYVCTPAEGLFRWTSPDPAGPWTLDTIHREAGWEDPCPFWDDDGFAYLIRGAVGAGPLILHKMSADGRRLLDTGTEIYRGPVAEGPKLFKRNGWYYISLPEGGVEAGGQTLLRSRSLYGPYERREVLPYGSPHQGALVDLPGGETWFMAFKSTGHFGRVCHLLPVVWGEDDWPVFGDRGLPVLRASKPRVAEAGSPMLPQRSDGFDSATLSPQWQWNHNPVDAAWSLIERPGWLRLRGLPAAELPKARNTVTQKLWAPAGTITVRMDVSQLGPDQRAGLTFLGGSTFLPIGVHRVGDERVLCWGDRTGPEIKGTRIWLRGVYQGQHARLAYSFDGQAFVDTGVRGNLRAGHWKGARVGLFCYGPEGGQADFDFFDYELDPPAD